MARCSKKRWGVWEWSNTSGAKAHSFLSIRNAALEGPLFHGIPQAGASWSVPSRPVERVGPYALSLGERDVDYPGSGDLIQLPRLAYKCCGALS